MATGTCKPKTKSQTLYERVASSGVVDKQAGVIRGVKILGTESANGRTYTQEAIRGAAKLYENIGVFADHPHRATPDQERKVSERLGWLENIQVKRDGLYGDLHILKSHPLAAAVFEAAERNPRLIGLSHNATGDTKRVDGRTFVERVTSVRSVDLVTDPATTRGLFESYDPAAGHVTTPAGELMLAFVQGKSLNDSELEKIGMRHGKSRFREAINSGEGSGDVKDDRDPEAIERERKRKSVANPWQALEQACRNQINDAFDSSEQFGDFETKLEQLAEIIKSYQSLARKLPKMDDGSERQPEFVGDDAAVEESRRRWPGRGRSTAGKSESLTEADEKRKRLLAFMKRPGGRGAETLQEFQRRNG